MVGPGEIAGGVSADNIGGISSGDLLTLIVALSVYISTVRLLIIDRLAKLKRQKQPPQKTEARLRSALFWLMPADVPLICAAVLLTWRLFAGPLFWPPAPAWTSFWISALFMTAIFVLVLHHVIAWGQTIWRGLFTREGGSREEQPHIVPAMPVGRYERYEVRFTSTMRSARHSRVRQTAVRGLRPHERHGRQEKRDRLRSR